MGIINQFPVKPSLTPGKIQGGVLRTAKGRFRLKMEFDVSGQPPQRFYLTLPSTGGVRLTNAGTGFFCPEANEALECEELPTQDGRRQILIRSARSASSARLLWDDKGFCIEAADGDGNTRFTLRSSDLLFLADEQGRPRSVKLFTDAGEDERFFGLGERFNSFFQKQVKIPLWNIDCGSPPFTQQKQANSAAYGYKNVPLVHSSKGYSLFFNTFYSGEAVFGLEQSGKNSFEFFGPQFDLFVWTDTPRRNLRSYLELTGRPPLPPAWVFQYWAGGAWPVWNRPDDRNAVVNVTEILDEYRQRGFPIEVCYLEVFPCKEIYDALEERNIRPLMWTDSMMRLDYPSRLDRDSLLVRRQSSPDLPMRGDYIDFSNPASANIITEKYEDQWDWGLRGLMIDYADNVYEDALFHNGKTGVEMHNFYAYWYARRFCESWRDKLGGDFILFQRSGCAGSQHYAGSFGGDMPISFEGLKMSLRAGLSAGASGFSLWGSDIGGFFKQGPRDEELYLRWLQFGAFSPLMRCHGMERHEPWLYGDRAENCFRHYFWLRYGLLDKMYSEAVACHVEGGTLMQSTAMEFDGAAAAADDQYLFCRDFLVCPVTEAGVTERTVALPKGSWFGLSDGVRREGNRTVRENAPPETMPVFVRAGAVIPLRTPREGGFFGDMRDGFAPALLLTAPDGERAVTVYAGPEDRCVFRSVKTGGTWTVTAERPESRERLLVWGETPAGITVDGTPLPCRDHDGTAEQGWYAQSENGLVLQTGKPWTTLTFCRP